ncbi:VOC family protein [Novosphingobium sp.]|uniref:VOC family protein n=1 Tax=Novosphingobium sp. TaxID=1874826 RepID=UPI002FD986F4
MEPAVTQIGYLEIETAARPSWLKLASLIGFEIDVRDHAAGLRMDADRWARIILREGEAERLSAIGWEAASPTDFQAIVQRLEQEGAAPKDRPDLALLQNVERLAEFTDPDGNRCELFWGARTTIRSPFRSPEHVTFVAGESGMGHATLAVADIARSIAFYQKALGLKLTEIADVGQLQVAFLRAGTRHHSLAMAQTPSGRPGIDHIMVEVATLDDLGAIRDRLIAGDHPIERDLGRHPTDGVVSLYAATPAPFNLEIGWGSIAVDERTWAKDRYERRGWSWGHRKPGAPEAQLGAIEPHQN